MFKELLHGHAPGYILEMSLPHERPVGSSGRLPVVLLKPHLITEGLLAAGSSAPGLCV